MTGWPEHDNMDRITAGQPGQDRNDNLDKTAVTRQQGMAAGKRQQGQHPRRRAGEKDSQTDQQGKVRLVSSAWTGQRGHNGQNMATTT
jgi:hypothetical protein